ncbi:MAG: B-box zinc finger protein [Anaerolineales bacterium]
MTEAALVCVNHPGRVTSLRCNRCDKPICVDCAVQTPVGYRCRECVRDQQEIFETASNLQVGLATVIAWVGAAIAVGILSFLGFFGLILAPVAGGGIAELVRLSMRGGRSRNLPMAAAVGAGLGVLAYGLIRIAPFGLFMIFGSGGFDPGLLLRVGSSLLWPLAYGALMIGTLFYRLRGIRI